MYVHVPFPKYTVCLLLEMIAHLSDITINHNNLPKVMQSSHTPTVPVELDTHTMPSLLPHVLMKGNKSHVNIHHEIETNIIKQAFWKCHKLLSFNHYNNCEAINSNVNVDTIHLNFKQF